MDRKKGNRLEKLSNQDYESLLRKIISFVKKEPKTFDELSGEFDLSYSDIEEIGANDEFTVNVAIKAGNAVVELHRSAWTLEFLGDEK